MSVRSVIEKGSIRLLLRAFAVWVIAALCLCFAAACLIRAGRLPSSGYAYFSSALSFLCALAAGAAGSAGQGRLRSGLLCGAALIVVLLTLGFLIAGREMETSGILSVVSFTMAGSLAGSVLFGGSKIVTNSSTFKKKKKQRR